MTSLLLTKELRGFPPASALLRNSSGPRPRKYRTSQYYCSATLSRPAPYYGGGLSPSTAKFAVASASSAASIGYRSRLMDSLTSNERLRRSIVALMRDNRRNWRITAALLDVVIGYLDDADQLSANHADFLFRCCGRLTPAAPAPKRVQYLKTLWNSLPRLGLAHGLAAYVRLQQMLLQNRQMFSPSGFLDRVRKAGYEPNAYLYLGAVIRCAMDEQPNFDEINRYVEAVRHSAPVEKEIWVKTRGAIVTAYAMARDTEKLRVLLEEERREDASSDVKVHLNQYYFSCALVSAQRGDVMSMFKFIDQGRRECASLNDFQLLYMARWLAEVGRQDTVFRLLNYMPKQDNWIYRTLPFVLTLIADGHYVTALTVLQRSASAAAVVAYPPAPSPDPASAEDSQELLPTSDNVFHFLLDLFYLKLPAAQITAFCRRLVDCGYTNDAFQLAAVAAYDAKQDDIAQRMLAEAYELSSTQSLRTIKSEDEIKTPPTSSLRPIHFRAALRNRSLLGDLDSVLEMLKRMETESSGSGVRTLSSFVLRYFYSSLLNPDLVLAVFGGVRSRKVLLTAGLCVCLREGDGQRAGHFLHRFPRTELLWHSMSLIKSICSYYQKTYDAQLVIEIVKRIEEGSREWNLTARSLDRSLVERTDEKVLDQHTACAESIYCILSRKLCKPEMDDFVSALEKAGITIPSRSHDLGTDETP